MERVAATQQGGSGLGRQSAAPDASSRQCQRAVTGGPDELRGAEGHQEKGAGHMGRVRAQPGGGQADAENGQQHAVHKARP